MKQYLQPIKIGDSFVIEQDGHKSLEYDIVKVINILNKQGEEEITIKIKFKGINEG